MRVEIGKDISKPEQLITEHIDIWTSAVLAKSTSGRGSSKKYELYGITKLRELILELAVRGKLVPQDDNDEPASVLLEKISDEKAYLIKEGEIKKTKLLPELTEDEKPFESPQGWCFYRLGDLVEKLGSGSTPRGGRNAYVSEGIPFLRSQNVRNEGLDDSDIAYISSETHQRMNNTIVYPGDILLNITGASLGRTIIFPNTYPEANVSQHVTIIRLIDPNITPFIYLCIRSPLLQKIVWERQVGMAIEGLSKKVLELFEIPIPPLAEQKRVVAKVDELMMLCDQLEQQTESSIDAHATLVEVLLATLTDSADADELAQNWARISEHFDSLFTTEQSIEALKQTVLQLAVMGKLVPQNPEDEPASVLLEKIAEEKERLIEDKKIKPRKALPPIENEEKLFDLPLGWEWCRLDDICDGITSGSTPPKSSFIDETGIPYLKVYNIRNQKIDFEYQPQFIEEGYHSSSLKRSQLCPGDVIMNIVGPPLGKIAIIPDTYPQWNCNQAIVMFRPFISDLNKFIYTYLVSGMFLDKIALIGTAGQDNISVTKSRSILLPTPPLAEQLRIVAKIDELMVICDQLKLSLKQSQETQVQLTDALVDRALG
ncbi:restriction endonuclease subunit S [Psychrobacter fozii]|uniref:Type I restriction enzyme S subunit n=1 Tax=Psychrobacter fozii TaxID=198480 RepID=A0A2V4UHY2_9GAMM|nr:restriction endonuclease subunit S [Psychrobacter fozii]PYE38459.1 type I restriction enzyme S subunit [Psychrobacter fozii]